MTESTNNKCKRIRPAFTKPRKQLPMVCDEIKSRYIHTHGKQHHSHPHRHDDGHHDHTHPYVVIGEHSHDHDHEELTHTHDHSHDSAHMVQQHTHSLEHLTSEEASMYFAGELCEDRTSEIWEAITQSHDKAYDKTHHHPTSWGSHDSSNNR